MDTGRDPAIQSHTTGIQRALEVVTVRSRLSAKSPRIPAKNAKVAIWTNIQGLCEKVSDKKK
jgi:hypothetical protein